MKRLLIVILGLSLCSTGFRPVKPVNRPLLTPGSTAPGVTSPDVATPDVATPDVATPDVATPDVATPDVATPDVATPDVATPDVATPDVATPDVATPDVATPDVATPDVATPDVATPDVATPDVATPGIEPVKLSWEILRDVTFKKKWYAEESVYMLYPTFGPGIQKLNGKMVELTGYILPVDLDANLYVLSAFPYSACFFCGGAGPESVVSLKFKKAGRKFKTDERLTFRGTLKLNADNIYELNYILTEAEIDS